MAAETLVVSSGDDVKWSDCGYIWSQANSAACGCERKIKDNNRRIMSWTPGGTVLPLTKAVKVTYIAGLEVRNKSSTWTG